jgi:hypothetical protein
MKPIPIAILAATLLTGAALAEMTAPSHKSGTDHSTAMAPGLRPVESGQSAFAAIQAIVAILEADPKTDWSRVDIEALRQHLIDMDNVTLGAIADATSVPGGIKYAVTGEGPIRDSIQRMIAAHAATMQGIDGWRYQAEMTDSGANLTILTLEDVAPSKLKGLGFIGVLARGMHHQEHHLMIAKQMGPHK